MWPTSILTPRQMQAQFSMDPVEWGAVFVLAAFGTAALKVVVFALRHGVVRNRHYFGPVYYRNVEPLEYYSHLLFWVTYVVSLYGAVAAVVHWELFVQ